MRAALNLLFYECIFYFCTRCYALRGQALKGKFFFLSFEQDVRVPSAGGAFIKEHPFLYCAYGVVPYAGEHERGCSPNLFRKKGANLRFDCLGDHNSGLHPDG